MHILLCVVKSFILRNEFLVLSAAYFALDSAGNNYQGLLFGGYCAPCWVHDLLLVPWLPTSLLAPRLPSSM